MTSPRDVKKNQTITESELEKKLNEKKNEIVMIVMNVTGIIYSIFIWQYKNVNDIIIIIIIGNFYEAAKLSLNQLNVQY